MIRYSFPVLTALIGYYLYRQNTAAYIRFVFWVWFLSAFIRRIVDYQAGWVDPNPILAAPMTASVVCFPRLLELGSVWRKPAALLFSLSLLCVIYGFALGIFLLPLSKLAVAFLSWSAPLIFGFFLFHEFSTGDRQLLESAVKQTFLYGTVVMGIYGIIQFVSIAPWDANWMIRSELSVIGTPEPFDVRVFSTMNGPSAVAWCLCIGVLCATSRFSLLTLLAEIFGYAGILLSSVRSAWLGLVFGIGLLLFKNKQARSHIAAVLLIVVLSVAVVGSTVAAMSNVIQERFSTFANARDDTSAQDRSNGYVEMIPYVAASPLGLGLGSMDIAFAGKTSLGSRDSGLLELLLSLGWIGGGVYLCCLAAIAILLLRQRNKDVPFAAVSAAISLGILLQIGLGSVMTALPGEILWGFAGISLGLHNASSREQKVYVKVTDTKHNRVVQTPRDQFVKAIQT